MTDPRPTPPHAGDRLPVLDLPTAAGPVPLRATERGSPVLFLPAREATPWLEARVRAFVDAAPDFAPWDARPIVVLPDGWDGRVPERPGVERVTDTDGRLRRRLGIADDESALLVADRWGVLYLAAHGTDPGALPTPDRVEEWVRFLATQCPECGVIDEPGHGEWSLT